MRLTPPGPGRFRIGYPGTNQSVGSGPVDRRRVRMGGVIMILRPPPVEPIPFGGTDPMEGILGHCNYRISCQPRGFEAPPPHSSGLGPLVPPEFSAETLAKARSFPMGAHPSNHRGGNHLARCKAASPAAALGFSPLQTQTCPRCVRPPGKPAVLPRSFSGS